MNPSTGQIPGRNTNKRQILNLLPGNAGAQTMQDPVTGDWFVRVWWDEKDKLQYRYCFTVNCDEGKVDNVSQFHGNILELFYGKSGYSIFKRTGFRFSIK